MLSCSQRVMPPVFLELQLVDMVLGVAGKPRPTPILACVALIVEYMDEQPNDDDERFVHFTLLQGPSTSRLWNTKERP